MEFFALSAGVYFSPLVKDYDNGDEIHVKSKEILDSSRISVDTSGSVLFKAQVKHTGIEIDGEISLEDRR